MNEKKIVESAFVSAFASQNDEDMYYTIEVKNNTDMPTNITSTIYKTNSSFDRYECDTHPIVSQR